MIIRTTYAISKEFSTSSTLISSTPSTAPSSCKGCTAEGGMLASDSEPALCSELFNAHVLKALTVEPFHSDRTRLFLAPGSPWLGEWLLRRRDLKSGWRAGTEAAMTPIFCSKLKVRREAGQVFVFFRTCMEVWKTYGPQMLTSTPLSGVPSAIAGDIRWFGVGLQVKSPFDNFPKMLILTTQHTAALLLIPEFTHSQRTATPRFTYKIPTPMIVHSMYLTRLFIWLFQNIRIGNSAQMTSVQMDHAINILVASRNSR